MGSRQVCAGCNREPDVCECPPEGDQRDRFPGRLRRYRVGAYVEFDVWAGDDWDACVIVTHLGIPDATRQPFTEAPMTMAGRIGHPTRGKRVTADAVRLRCLSVHENPEEES